MYQPFALFMEYGVVKKSWLSCFWYTGYYQYGSP